MKRFFVATTLWLVTSAAHAQVQVKDAWIRATVPHQTSTGAFMQLSSPTDARLVSATTPVAGIVELHEMTMDKDVMKMRAVPGIDIPAGKGVELKPGSYHVMLLNLKAQMKEGDTVPLTLVIEDAAKTRKTLEVKAQVRPLKTGGGDIGGMHMH